MGAWIAFDLAGWGPPPAPPPAWPQGAPTAVVSLSPSLTLVVPPPRAQDELVDLAVVDGDLPLTPAGDYAVVSGTARLIQDLFKLARSDRNLLDPEFVNAFAGMVGQPGPTPELAQAYAAALAHQIDGIQRRRIAEGEAVGANERIDGVDQVSVLIQEDVVTVGIVVRAVSGATAQAAVPWIGASNGALGR